MKVVLFCGGLGTRLKEYSETIPKPMVDIGYRPIMWHLMRYYAHYGHREFILCLGYRGDVIKNYFLNYNECLSNNFVLKDGGKKIHLYNNDIEDWTISFIDTGLNSNIGERLVAIKPYLEDDEVFMANYADGLSDLDLHQYLAHFYRQDKIASFVAVKPSQSFHVVSVGETGLVKSVDSVRQLNFWINGGFFILNRAIFDYIQPGEELVEQPFQRLIEKQELLGYRYPGFWACMDTFKEKKMLDDMYTRGQTPWIVWNHPESTYQNNYPLLNGKIPTTR